jgi:plastocyanin
MRRLAFVVAAAGLAGLLIPAAANADTRFIQIAQSTFTPHALTANQGDLVSWHNDDGIQHHVQSDQGFFDGPVLDQTDSYSEALTFRNAGSYPYHCTIHQSMTGVVKVPINASGSSGSGWQLQWSSLSQRPTTRNFDVQIKRPGSNMWRRFRGATTSRSTFFNPSTNGTYKFRSRTRIVGTGQLSNYSPVRTVSIT